METWTETCGPISGGLILTHAHLLFSWLTRGSNSFDSNLAPCFSQPPSTADCTSSHENSPRTADVQQRCAQCLCPLVPESVPVGLGPSPEPASSTTSICISCTCSCESLVKPGIQVVYPNPCKGHKGRPSAAAPVFRWFTKSMQRT